LLAFHGDGVYISLISENTRAIRFYKSNREELNLL